MCESKVYLKRNGKLELVAEDVVSLVPSDKGFKFIDISGRTYEVENAVIDHIDFVGHKVVLKPTKSS